MRDEHDTTPVVADEAVNDLDALWIDPDPSSKSGMSVRVIGYSATGRGLFVVTLVKPEADPNDKPDGDWWGANCWPANETAQRQYAQSNEQEGTQ